MKNYVQGKVVVVTGSGGGFGRLTCQEVARMGGFPVVSDVNVEAAKETATLIEAEGGKAVWTKCDVTIYEDVEALVKLAVDTYGKVDVFINNAGIMPLAPWSQHKVALKAWQRGIDINLKGTMHGICAVYDQMVAQGYGHVICMSSICGNCSLTGEGVYDATKIGVRYLARSLRQEAHGVIKVSVINPSNVPGTGLMNTIVTDDPSGCFGMYTDEYFKTYEEKMSGANPALSDINSIKYLDMEPEDLVEKIIYCINQPMGMTVEEITVRTANDMLIY